jgi:organic radical activating enzyme
MEYSKLIHKDEKHNNYVVVNWCMGNTCNFACSYCPVGLHDGSVPWYDFDDVKRFCVNVIEHYAPKTVYFEFTGGEVTLWKHFIDLCKFLKEKNAKVGLITNGSRTLRYWEELKPFVDHVCTSFHPEFSDEKRYLDFIKFLCNDIKVHANVMMKPEEFDRCVEITLKLHDIPNITVAMQPLIVDLATELYEYTDDQKAILNQEYIHKGEKPKMFENFRGSMTLVSEDGIKLESMTPHGLITKNMNNWVGWECDIGVEQIIVDMDGTIHRGWCKVGGPLGHVTDEKLNLPVSSVICDKQFCHCSFDIMATKTKVKA